MSTGDRKHEQVLRRLSFQRPRDCVKIQSCHSTVGVRHAIRAPKAAARAQRRMLNKPGSECVSLTSLYTRYSFSLDCASV
jgi:hypothetical protein